MYIWIYCAVIVLFCAGAILFFFLKKNKDRKRFEEHKRQIEAENVEEGINDLSNVESEKIMEEVKPQNVELENFALETDEIKDKPENELDDPFAVNLQGNMGREKEMENIHYRRNRFAHASRPRMEPSSSIDDKFAEYEEFLRRHLESESNENKSPEDEFPKFDFENEIVRPERKKSDYDALADFDFDSLQGKTEDEIKDIVKDLPPKAQEILLSEILAKKKYDDED